MYCDKCTCVIEGAPVQVYASLEQLFHIIPGKNVYRTLVLQSYELAVIYTKIATLQILICRVSEYQP